jgi:hypothetical protein
MAKKTTRKSAAPETPPTLSARQGLELLRRQCQKGEQLLANRPLSSDNNQAWKTATRDVLVQTYGSSSGNVSSFTSAGLNYSFGGGTEREWEEGRAERMLRQLTILRGLIEILEVQVSPEWVAQSPPPRQETSEAVRFINCTFPGEFSMAKQNVSAGGSITVGGHFVVADAVRESFNNFAQSQAAPDIKDLMKQLGETAVEMSKSLPPKKQQEVAQDLNTLATEAAKDPPRKSYIKLAAEGLTATATMARNVAVAGLVTALLKHYGIG